MPNLILEYLPAYSPDLSLIELVWHSAKEFIAHRLFIVISNKSDTLWIDETLILSGIDIFNLN
jgi:transposase